MTIALLALLALAAETQDVDELRLGERRPLVMLVIRPGAAKTSPAADLFRAADESLRPRTGLTIETPEYAGIDAASIASCAADELLACYSRAVPEASQRVRRRHLLVVTLFDRADGTASISSLLIDLDAAKRAQESIFGGDDEAKQRLEDAIFERTARATERVVDLRDAAAVGNYFQRLFAEDLRAMLESAGDYEPYGELLLEAAPPGLEIEIDGNLIGRTGSRSTLILEVWPRRLQLELSDPQQRYLSFTREVEVVRGVRARVVVELVRAADPGAAPVVRKAGFWGGIAVAAIGGAFTSYAIIASPSSERVSPCLGENCASNGGRFATFCELASERPSACSGSGALTAPLGYSMMLTGGVWTAGSLWWGDETELPWLPLLVGVVAGAAAYGVSAVANR